MDGGEGTEGGREKMKEVYTRRKRGGGEEKGLLSLVLTLSLPMGSDLLEYKFFLPSNTGFCCPKYSLCVLTSTSIISRLTLLGHLSGVMVTS